MNNKGDRVNRNRARKLENTGADTSPPPAASSKACSATRSKNRAPPGHSADLGRASINGRKIKAVTVELKPETERLVQDAIDKGQFKSVDDLLTRAIHIMREREEVTPLVPKKNFSQFLLDSPLSGSGLNLDRPKSFARPIDL